MVESVCDVHVQFLRDIHKRDVYTRSHDVDCVRHNCTILEAAIRATTTVSRVEEFAGVSAEPRERSP